MPTFKDLYDERDLLATVRGGDFYLEFVRGASGFGYFSVGTAQALADWIKANVPEPKPEWHDAKDGEVWLITLNESTSYPNEMAALVDNGGFLFKSAHTYSGRESVAIASDRVIAARRIYPEGESN